MPPSPFRLSSFVWEAQPGRARLTVVGVARVRLVQSAEGAWEAADDEPGLDEAQSRIVRADLRAPYKPRVDVVVVGKAYAPGRELATRLVAQLRVGDFTRAIAVTGDRLWARDGLRWAPSEPRPFSQVLLSAERAARSAENPHGFDATALPVEGRLALPNFEPIAPSMSASFGPVPLEAPTRVAGLPHPAASWAAAFEYGRAQGPLPEGFNFGVFQCAPVEQQALAIEPGATLVLEHLTPHEPLFVARLPRSIPRLVAIDRELGTSLELSSRIDSLWIDGDRYLAWVVVRGSCELRRADVVVDLACAIDPPRAPVAGPPSTRPYVPPGTRPVAGVTGPSLPAAAAGAYATPSARETAGDSYPPPPPPRQDRPITAEIELPHAPQAPSFEPGDAPPMSMSPISLRDEDLEIEAGDDDGAEELGDAELSDVSPDELVDTIPPVAPETPLPEVVIPPPPAAPPPPPELSPPPPPQRTSLTLEECAELRAKLSVRGAPRADVLADANVDDAAFARLEREHLRALDAASQAGDDGPLARYDEAYVAAADRLRIEHGLGPIDEAAWAQLERAKAQGAQQNALDELRLSSAERMRLERVWRRRAALDPALAARLDAARR